MPLGVAKGVGKRSPRKPAVKCGIQLHKKRPLRKIKT